MHAFQSKADLHAHSKHSDRPAEWLLRRIGAPESYVEPLEVYETCRARGMDFITITDHNRIDGALEIAHLPGTFISSEITTYFPEDGCKVHCLVYDITTRQFEAIQRVREDIYALRRLLLEQGILHSIAHPLYGVHDRLSVGHFEKLLLLFNRFEALNGSISSRTNKVTNAILRNLSAQTLDELAASHGIRPDGAEPWRKAYTAGSDDHSGVYLAGAYTVTPRARSVEEFLGYVRAGNCGTAGSAGNSLQFAHGLYHTAYGYYRQFFLNGSRTRNPLVGAIFRRLIEGRAGAPTLRRRIGDLLMRLVLSARKKRLSEVERLLVEQLQRFFEETGGVAGQGGGARAAGFDQRTFRIACHLSQQFGYTFLSKCVDYAGRGELTQCVQTVSALGPVALGIAPYLASFASQHKDEALHQEVARRFGFGYLVERSRGAVWLADAPDDAPLATLAEELQAREHDLTLITCAARQPAVRCSVRNFSPVGSLGLPHGSGEVAFPPFLDVLSYIERQAFSHLYISTPGPLGLTGLLAARLLRLRTTGVCHADYARLVQDVTGDDGLAQLTWRYLAWFYGQMDSVLVTDEDRRYELSENGVELEKLVVLPAAETDLVGSGSF